MTDYIFKCNICDSTVYLGSASLYTQFACCKDKRTLFYINDAKLMHTGVPVRFPFHKPKEMHIYRLDKWYTSQSSGYHVFWDVVVKESDCGLLDNFVDNEKFQKLKKERLRLADEVYETIKKQIKDEISKGKTFKEAHHIVRWGNKTREYNRITDNFGYVIAKATHEKDPVLGPNLRYAPPIPKPEDAFDYVDEKINAANCPDCGGPLHICQILSFYHTPQKGEISDIQCPICKKGLLEFAWEICDRVLKP